MIVLRKGWQNVTNAGIPTFLLVIVIIIHSILLVGSLIVFLWLSQFFEPSWLVTGGCRIKELGVKDVVETQETTGKRHSQHKVCRSHGIAVEGRSVKVVLVARRHRVGIRSVLLPAALVHGRTTING